MDRGGQLISNLSRVSGAWADRGFYIGLSLCIKRKIKQSRQAVVASAPRLTIRKSRPHDLYFQNKAFSFKPTTSP